VGIDFDKRRSKPKGEVIAVIDGDVVAFRVAAACEKRSVLVTNKASNQQQSFNNRTEFLNLLKGVLLKEDVSEYYDIVDVQTPEELPHCLNTIKQSIAGIMARVGATKKEIYISGEGNFRDALPLPKKYKGGRADTLKPVLLEAAREYLVKHQGAIPVNSREADDACAQRAFEGFKSKQKIVQITNDKDSLGCDGWVFNPDNMEEPMLVHGLGKLWIDDKGKVRGYGRKWKYTQWLYGDPVDFYSPQDICGLRYGEKSAYKDLVDLETDLECLQKVHDRYKEWYPEPVTYTCWEGKEHTKDYLEIAQMYFDCVHMLRFPDERLKITDIFDKVGVVREKIQDT
jgi:hypothetical protein